MRSSDEFLRCMGGCCVSTQWTAASLVVHWAARDSDELQVQPCASPEGCSIKAGWLREEGSVPHIHLARGYGGGVAGVDSPALQWHTRWQILGP